MSFGLPALLWLLLLVPLAVWALVGSARRREARRRAYADPHLLGAVLPPTRPARSRWPLALQLLALALLLFGAAAPTAQPRLPTNQASVMIALDASRSMLADDVKPSRLEAALNVARQFAQLAPASTRIGLLTFSDNASVLLSPTTDRQELLDALKRVRAAQSTSYAGAVVGGVRALPGRADVPVPEGLRGGPPTNPAQTPQATPKPVNPATLPPGALLLLSDGISNRGADPRLAARFASDNRVKLYAVALGKEGGAVSTIGGQTVFVPFDTRSLEQLTQLGGGKFISPPDPDKLRELFRELGSVIQWKPSKLDLGGPLAGLAALLMVIAGALALRWQRRVP